MEPRISFVTLGVSDFDRAVKFYRDGLVFPVSSASKDDVAFFKMSGVVLALYASDKLADDAHVSPGDSAFRGVTLAHNVRRREEVSEVLAVAARAGGMKPAQDTFWGGHGATFRTRMGISGRSSGIRFVQSLKTARSSSRELSRSQ